jgi:hypothetical protein
VPHKEGLPAVVAIVFFWRNVRSKVLAVPPVMIVIVGIVWTGT